MAAPAPARGAPLRVCVVGAGIIGMSSALLVSQSLEGSVEVTVVADQFSPDTTGDVAGGLLLPHKLNDTSTQLIKRWYSQTMKHAASLHNSDSGAQAGAMITTQNMFYTTDMPTDPYWAEFVPCFHRMTAADLDYWRPYCPVVKSGVNFQSYTLDSRYYMPWLMDRLKEHDVKMIKKKLNNIKEVFDDYDVVVVCPGVGAFHLLGDSDIQPSRGQVIRVKAPWVRQMYAVDDGKYFAVQGVDCLVLGDSSDDVNWSRQLEPQQTSEIWRQHLAFLPNLKGAPVLEQSVGLRPIRSSVRLEQEQVCHGNRDITVVYNYGHGGSGFGLHWGCAEDVAGFVAEAVKNRMIPAKL